MPNLFSYKNMLHKNLCILALFMLVLTGCAGQDQVVEDYAEQDRCFFSGTKKLAPCWICGNCPVEDLRVQALGVNKSQGDPGVTCELAHLDAIGKLTLQIKGAVDSAVENTFTQQQGLIESGYQRNIARAIVSRFSASFVGLPIVGRREHPQNGACYILLGLNPNQFERTLRQVDAASKEDNRAWREAFGGRDPNEILKGLIREQLQGTRNQR